MTDGQIIAVATIGSIASIITIWGTIFKVIKWKTAREQKDKEEQNRKLKIHLEELKSKVVDPMINVASHVTERDGDLKEHTSFSDIVTYNQFPLSFNFEEGDQFDSFKMHFPRLATKWEKLKRKINKHNGNHSGFRQKIETDLTPLPCTLITAFEQLYNRWKELADKRRPWPDFKLIEGKPYQGGYGLYAEGWGSSATAQVSTEEDIEKCGRALYEVSENKEYRDEAAKIHKTASDLISALQKFANELGETMDDIIKYWPNGRFKKLKTCPICQKF